MKPTRFFPLLAGLCSIQMQLTAAPSIGVNFVNGGDHVNNSATDSIGSAESAGAPTFAQINWNNLGRWGENVLLNPTAGIPGVRATWDSIGTWNNGASNATPDGKLMSGYLDASWGQGVNSTIAPGTSVFGVGNNNKPIVFVGNIGSWLTSPGVNATTYSVVIYFDGDGAPGERTAEFWLQSVEGAYNSMTVGTDLTPHIFGTDPGTFDPLTGYTQATSTELADATAGNYIVYTGLSADQFLIRGEEHGWASDAITGFQIIADAGPVEPQGFYWKGNASNSWADVNWDSDPSGAGPFTVLDPFTPIVSFAANDPDNLATVLGADQSISKLNLTNGVGAVQIGSAVGFDHNLTLAYEGISVESGTGPLTINTTGQVILDGDQTWINNAAGPLTVNSVIAGDYRLTTSGGGTTVLTAANVHTGGTTVESGTLKVTTAAAFGTGSLVVNGTLDLDGLNLTLVSLAGTGTITNSSASPSTLTLDLPADSSYATKINDSPGAGPVSLVKEGDFSLTSTGNSNFTGSVTINGGQFIANYANYGGAPVTSSLGNLQVPGRTITVNSPGTLALTNNNIFGNGNADAGLLPEIIVNGTTVSATNYNLIGDITLNAATLSQTTGNVGYQGYQFRGDVTVIKDVIEPLTVGPSFISGTGGNHLSVNTKFDVEDATGDGVTIDDLYDLTVSTPLIDRSGDFGAGPGGLTKMGVGTMRLEGANIYTGATRVLEGVLSMGAPTLSDVAVVEIATDAVLDLTYEGNDQVAMLIIGETPMPDGIYGADGSDVDPGFELSQITGSGTIEVVSPYLQWISTFTNLSGLTAEKGADPDFDGLTNLEEFALDGNPEDGTATGKVRARVETVGDQQALVITLPVHNGASSFTGNAPATATVEAVGITYEIGGSNDLINFDQNVSQVVPALTGTPDMPSVSTGWTYRTFRLNGAVTARGPKGFLRANVNVTEAP